jgi:hypothetical protein
MALFAIHSSTHAPVVGLGNRPDDSSKTCTRARTICTTRMYAPCIHIHAPRARTRYARTRTHRPEAVKYVGREAVGGGGASAIEDFVGIVGDLEGQDLFRCIATSWIQGRQAVQAGSRHVRGYVRGNNLGT